MLGSLRGTSVDGLWELAISRYDQAQSRHACVHRLGGSRKNLDFGISISKEMSLHIRM